MHRGYWLGAPSALSTDPIHVRAEKSTVCSQTFPKILPVYAFLLQIEAVEEFDRLNPNVFWHDTKRETKFGFTWNPNGFLIKK